MKTTIKLLLVITLFCGSILADGNQGSGGRECPPEGCPPPCTENCGGNVAVWNDDEPLLDAKDYADEIAEIVKHAWNLVLY